MQDIKKAHLHWSCDADPGITREPSGKHWRYRDTKGRVIRDAKTIERINHIGIPPAWKNVWICPSPSGHMQATGKDAKGRTQYRYHARWREVRDATKFHKLELFAKHLPIIRKHVTAHLHLPHLSHEKMIATVVRLLDITHMRIGNEMYEHENHSYGLTTLLDRHVHVHGAEVRFQFRGKSGQDQDVTLRDRTLARIILACEELPGHFLFQYIDHKGALHPVTSDHVNEYLHAITREPLSAKDFRTWGATVQAALSLLHLGETDNERERASRITRAVSEAAQALGNRPATCRKYYIDPRILHAYNKSRLCPSLERYLHRSKNTGDTLHPLEKGVLNVITHQTYSMDN